MPSIKTEQPNENLSKSEFGIIYDENDSEIHCRIYHDRTAGGPILIEVARKATAYDQSRPLSDLSQNNIIYGYLNKNLLRFALLGINKWQHSTTFTDRGEIIIEEVFAASFIFYGVERRTTLRSFDFTEVRYDFSNLIQFGDHSAIMATKNGRLQCINETKPLLLWEDHACSIFYSVIGHNNLPQGTTIVSDSVSLHQKGTIKIQSKFSQPIQFFDSLVCKLERLFSFLSLDKSYLERAFACKTKHVNIEFYRLGMLPFSNKFLSSFETRIAFPKSQPRLLSFDNMVKKGSFREFFTHVDDLLPILECILSVVRADNPISPRLFVDIVRALEMIHNTFYSNHTILDLETKANNFNLANSRSLTNKTDVRVFLLGRKNIKTSSKPHPLSLRHKIADLMTPGNRMPFYGDYVDKDFPFIVAETRNYYVHGTPRQNSKGEGNNKTMQRITDITTLWSVMGTLLDVLDWHIMHKLNINLPFNSTRLRTILIRDK